MSSHLTVFSHFPAPCDADAFFCHSNMCINNTLVCNGMQNCVYPWDENQCKGELLRWALATFALWWRNVGKYNTGPHRVNFEARAWISAPWRATSKPHTESNIPAYTFHLTTVCKCSNTVIRLSLSPWRTPVLHHKDLLPALRSQKWAVVYIVLLFYSLPFPSQSEIRTYRISRLVIMQWKQSWSCSVPLLLK